MITYTGILAIFDGRPDSFGDIINEDTAINLPSSKVPVTFYHKPDKEDFHIGTAQLFIRDGEILYKMEMLDECVMPKHILDRYYPCLGGVLQRNKGSNIIKGVSIDSIILNSNGNADIRIGPLGEQDQDWR